MTTALTDSEIQSALDECATEPVHIPGNVQPYACLIALDPKSTEVSYVSANTVEIIGLAPPELLGQQIARLLPHELWHQLNNVRTLRGARQKAHCLGAFDINGTLCTAHASLSGDLAVLELEHTAIAPSDAGFDLQTLDYLAEEIQRCDSEQALCEATAELLQHLTGYDRVMVYSFDPAFNGTVVAERARPGMPSFLGLHFPHWDIPPQAREMMKKVPVRFIQSTEQEPVPILAAAPDAAPLDISLSFCRGVSLVHMEYLRNMGSAATLTLSVVLEDKLWGMISFHSNQARVPSPGLRQLLVSVGRAFTTKLQVLLQGTRLDIVTKVEALKDQMVASFDDADGFDAFAESVLTLLDASGLVLIQNGETLSRGTVPDAPLLEEVTQAAREADETLAFESLAEAFPRNANALNGCAGALALAPVFDRIFLVFRQDQARDVTWAGNPDKTITPHDGRLRLSPRGSFSAYLSEVKDHAKPWSEQDRYFSSRIWSLVNTVERRVMMTSLNRQQQIMINELNHRVRNMLALIRSVSQQARRSSTGTLESYSKSLESRIEALAASHNLASGSLSSSVRIEELILTEFQPFGVATSERCTFKGPSGNGPSGALAADVAPIFSLVIHELVTNAVKYGALSNDTGTVSLSFEEGPDGLEILWREQGGPAVRAPEAKGFGTTLITQAIAHELGGQSELEFHPDGVRARLFLPAALFDLNRLPGDSGYNPIPESAPSRRSFEALGLHTKSCLIVEDNFMIAQEMREQLGRLGVGGAIEICATAEAALAIIEAAPADFAILDVNLGRDATSLPVADRLSALGIPFFFVTGYGDSTSMPEDYRHFARLTKPVMDTDLRNALLRLFRAPSETPE